MGNTEPGERVIVGSRLLHREIPVTLAGALLVLLPWIDFWPSRLVSVLQALLPLLCLAAVAYSVVLLFKRAWILATVLLVCLGLSLAPTLAPGTRAVCPPGSELTVLSLNAGRGHTDPTGLAKEVSQADPDILVLVEASEPMIKALASSTAGWDYTERTGPVRTGGSVDTVILSRYPLRSEEPAALQSDGALFDIPVALIDLPRAGQLRVAGIHPVPPTHDPASWERTLNVLADWVQPRTDLPLVLAGDFNGTRAHPQFRALADGFDEVPPSYGPVPMGTWPANSVFPAFAAIDHVLVRGMASQGSQRFSVPGTDHFGIIAQLSACG